MQTPSTQPFSRHIAILIILAVGTSFASAHIAARITFDSGTGLLTAVLARSTISLLLIVFVALFLKQKLSMPWRFTPWQLLLGLLIAMQSISIYLAVSRIPVGIALLLTNTFPAQLALITWALGGKPPTRKAALLMGLILIGLLLALNIPGLLNAQIDNTEQWITGVGFSLFAAFVFSIGMWITEHKMKAVMGSSRSFYTMLVVLIVTSVAGYVEIIPDGLNLPSGAVAWFSLCLLSALYALSFITLFTLAPRLNLSQNAPAMNIEPIASLSMGWFILGQQLTVLQITGGIIVVVGIVAFSYAKT